MNGRKAEGLPCETFVYNSDDTLEKCKAAVEHIARRPLSVLVAIVGYMPA